MNSLFSVILLTVHLMLALALIGVVLLQRSEGGMGGLGGGGMSGFMTTRGTANLLTRTTRWLAGAFMATSLVLAWIAVHAHTPRTIMAPGKPPVEAPQVPTPDQTGGAAGTAPPASNSPATGSTSGTPSTTSTPPAPTTPAVPTNQ